MTEETREWVIRQNKAIEAQRAFHKAINAARDDIGAVPAASSGPLANYTRGQTLSYISQLRNVLEHGTMLPNSGPLGLTIDPATERQVASEQTITDYTELSARLIAAGEYTDEEVAKADALLAKTLADGVSLDAATAESA